MKFNLKNPLWQTDPQKAKEGFEKELKEDKDWCERCLAEDPLDEYCMRKLKWIKEILGDV